MAYWSVLSKHFCAPATQPAAPIRRSPWSSHMMWWKPLPSWPSSASAGTRTSWNASSAVSLACIPSFSSFFSRITPGESMSTRNRLKPS